MSKQHAQENSLRRPLLCYYGDDFTGSTDAMEALATNGLRTVLFLSPPSPQLLASRFPDAQCFGVAGVSRSMSPVGMELELRPQLELLKASGAEVVHYKICSTFDSSPRTGSIGKVLELGRELFAKRRYVPIMAGVPVLKRYTVFGQHFAAAGESTFRLDRHPTMSRHPITPMHEADLRLHLREQTDKVIALMDVLALDGAADDVQLRLDHILASSPEAEAVLFDVLDNRRLEMAGKLIWDEAGRGTEDGGLFVIGSSGVEYALAAHWRSHGIAGPANDSHEMAPPARTLGAAPAAATQLLVISGSCSPVTEAQINQAMADGYVGIQVPVHEWLDPHDAERSRSELLERAVNIVAAGHSLILYSAVGPQDPSIGVLREALLSQGMEAADSGRFIGGQLGRLTKDILAATNLNRILIAGGDTSGYVTRELGIYAMECLSTIVPGGPLCRCYSDDPRMDGLQLSLKGGQVGGSDYFERVRKGG